MENTLKRITWLGHASVRIDTPSAVVYVDPWKLKSFEPADIILISHEHYDHFSKDDVAQLCKEGTVIVTTPAVAEQLTGDVRAVRPGDTVTVKGVKIEAVPAYNLTKFRPTGEPCHPQPNAWLGFIVDVDGMRVYHAGDTDNIPEMANMKPDIAILPVSGKYVMTADEAIDAVRMLKPKAAIPIHFGAGVAGTLADAEQFQREAATKVHILQPE